MGYLGKSQSESQTTTVTRDLFTGTGAEVNFTLTAIPPNEQSIIVTINGVMQQDAAYTFSGTTLTFDAAPADGALIEARTFSNAAQGYVPALNSVTNNHLAPESIDRDKFKAFNLGNSPRQTVLAGGVDDNGQANFIVAGTGLAATMSAGGGPIVTSFANGYDDQGAVDYIGRHTITQSDFWSSLPVWNTSYLYMDRNSTTGALTSYQSLVPPQYGTFFDKSKQALLPFSGADASTTITDTYGNTWTVAGDAQIDTGVTIDGQNTLLLDGTGDWINNTSITSLPVDGWTIEAKLRMSALPTSTVDDTILHIGNAATYGLQISVLNTAGTYYIKVYASSTGSSHDIASANSIAITPVVDTNYHFAVTWDKMAGRLYTYWDGVKKNDVAMTTNICAVTNFRFGATVSGADFFQGRMAGIRLSPFCRYPAGTTFTPPTLPFAADAEWFDTSEFKWKYGSPTSWTEKQRVCIGEVTTNATVPTSVTTYALRGAYSSPRATPPETGSATSVSHNIGVASPVTRLKYHCVTAEVGYVPGDELDGLMGLAGTSPAVQGVTATSRTAGFAVPSNGTRIPNKDTGAVTTLTVGKWVYQLHASRGW